MKKKIIAFVFSFIMVVSAASGVAAAKNDAFTATNVILLIGSGISQDHIKAAETKLGHTLNISKMQYGGLLDTLINRNLVPDNASAATALATGQATNRYYVGVNSQDVSVETIAENAKKNNKKVCIISDKNLNDATTAAFSSHVTMKTDLHNIAKQQIMSDFDLFMGGGSYYYDKYSDLLKEEGYKYIKSKEMLDDISSEDGKIFAAFSNFGSGSTMPALSDMIIKATEVLDNDNGFLIVAEGSGVNSASLSKNMSSMVSEMGKFDEAVGSVMKYVDSHPNTLLVVCGDCEAGELILPSSPTVSNINNSCFNSNTYTGEKVPYYLYGNNSSVFNGDNKNTCIPYIVAGSMGLFNFADDNHVEDDTQDYITTQTDSFSKWNFANVRKNSSVAGIKMTTTSSNNSAVTAMCNKGASLVIMANAKVGFDITFKSPLALPFVINGNNDLSSYEGFVMKFGSVDIEYTISVGRDGGNNPFKSSITVTSDMINKYGEALLPYASFEPAITADMAKGMNLFEVASSGSAEKTTNVIYGIDVYNNDDTMNYYQTIATAMSIDENAYSAESFDAFKAKFDIAKSASGHNEIINAKHELLNAIDGLVEKRVNTESIDINSTAVSAQNAVVNKNDGFIKVFCGLNNPSVTIGELSGNGQYDGVRIKLSSDDFAATSTDEFSVVINSKNPNVDVTVNRPLMKEGYYYFVNGISTIPSSITLSFSGMKPGAVINILNIEFFNYADESNFTKSLSERIVRASAGYSENISADEGDINKDGLVNICDALELIRY